MSRTRRRPSRAAEAGPAGVQAWFPTLIYDAALGGPGAVALNRELLRESQQLREFDVAGQRWSERYYPGGYTSYGSMDRLHEFSSTFDALRRRIDRHVQRFVAAQQWDLRGGGLSMSDCWLNIMPRGTAHSFHLHPQSVLSGTYYVKVPKGAPGLKFEDPRLSRMMAAPARQPDADPRTLSHIEYAATAGHVILFESWLRHEVAANRSSAERISISFNYHWS